MRRTRRARDAHHLESRTKLLAVGAVISLVGLYTDRRWVIWVAIAVLLSGFLLRFFPAPAEEASAGQTEGDPEAVHSEGEEETDAGGAEPEAPVRP